MLVRNLLAAAFVASLMIATPSVAQWSGAEKEEFKNDCLAACRNNPNVPEARRPQCLDYCACVQDSAEKAEPNYKTLNDDFLQGRDTERVRSVKGSVPACNRKAFAPR